jgi:hypothetical protein
MAESGEESLYKRMVSFNSQSDALKLIQGLSSRLDPESVIGRMAFEVLETGIVDEDSVQRLPGIHECFLEGLHHPNREMSYPVTFIIDVERQISKANQLILEGKIQDAVESLIDQPIAKHLLWPDALELLGKAKTKKDLFVLNISVSFEVLLAIIAARDVHLSRKQNITISVFESVFPCRKLEDKNPTALLFEDFKQILAASSIGDLMDKTLYPETFFKRWSSGKQLPSYSKFFALVSSHLEAKDRELMLWRYFVVKMLNFIGYTSQEICKSIQVSLTEEQKAALRPFPDWPFCNGTITDWLSARYPYWLNYHQQVINQGG